MKTKAMVIAAALALLPASASAQSVVAECGGLDAGYRAWVQSGAAAAVEGWVAGTGLNGQSLMPALMGVEEMFGRVTGYEVIREVVVSPSLRRIYTVALHELAPSFGAFDCYRTGGRWTLTNIRVNSKEEILPADVFWTGGGGTLRVGLGPSEN